MIGGRVNASFLCWRRGARIGREWVLIEFEGCREIRVHKTLHSYRVLRTELKSEWYRI